MGHAGTGRRSPPCRHPLFPVSPTVTIPSSRAALIARRMLAERPEGRDRDQHVALAAEPAHLPLEELLVAVIVADCRQDRGVGRQRDRRCGRPVVIEPRQASRRRDAGRRPRYPPFAGQQHLAARLRSPLPPARRLPRSWQRRRDRRWPPAARRGEARARYSMTGAVAACVMTRTPEESGCTWPAAAGLSSAMCAPGAAAGRVARARFS